MAETYCSKSCAACESRELLGCPGCKTGPGERIHGDCEIARCCREKGHETCESCSIRPRCGSFRGKENMPRYRASRQQAELESREKLAEEIPFLGKWLWLLFWLVIPSALSGLMTNEVVGAWSAGLYTVGLVLSILTELAWAGILLKLAFVEEQYRKAGILCLVAVAANLGAAVLSSVPFLGLLVAGTQLVVTLLAKKREYRAHSAVAAYTDPQRAVHWELLWKWFVGAWAALLAGLFVTLLFPVLGAVSLIIAAIVMVIVRIAELVLLYGTAKSFRDHPAG